ncbi:LysE family translocator [Ponticaulis profundi]|uniref:LysE family translocator n=1 Tax=Ponticaulis profundi TaxID=2665222 RepID=A0ABW1S878_9PROT
MLDVINLADIALVVSVFAIGAASPGPATLMIVKTAAEQGRMPALILSVGIVCGSVFWGILAGLGFVALLQASAFWFTCLKMAGGAYLLFLAYRAVRSAMTPGAVLKPGDERSAAPWHASFLKGLFVHLTNPKAPLVWLATLSIGADHGSSPDTMALAIFACALAAMAIFTGYAFLFSTRSAMRFYQRAHRPINLLAGALFGAIGVKLLSSKAGLATSAG